MRLRELAADHESFLRLERYVNVESPSGYSTINTPGVGFRAKDAVTSFPVPVFAAKDAGGITLGAMTLLEPGEIPIHPEMTSLYPGAASTPVRYIEAIPTSSGRTLSARDRGRHAYVKVAYLEYLGRARRPMTKAHVVSALEVSAAYERAITDQKLPATVHVYREQAGLYFPEGPFENWGYVERDLLPFPGASLIQIPAFSLDKRLPNGIRPLLWQVIDLHPHLRGPEAFFSSFLLPLLDLYFGSVREIGLQPEAHAQNVIFLFDDTFLPVGVALRDMESVDKDVPLLEANHTLSHFSLTRYKFLHKDAYYQIKHSFMYDFKLGRYILAPIISSWSECTGHPTAAVDALVRDEAHEALKTLPEGFLPSDAWYDYEDIIHEGDGPRPYRRHENPRFR